MVDVPRQVINVRDPGLGLAPAAADRFVFIGASEKGDVNEIKFYNTKNQVVQALGQGELSEALCTFLAVAGGPVIGVRASSSSAEGTVGGVTTNRADASVGTLSASDDSEDGYGPFDTYSCVVRIVTTGDLGSAEFQYSLDGTTFSPTLTVPAGGKYSIPNTGVEIEFDNTTPGDVVFEEGDEFSFETVGRHYTISTLNDAMEAVKASTDEFVAVVLCGREASSSDGASMFAALDVHLTELANGFQFVGALMDSGIDDASTVKAAFANAQSSRIGVTYGTVNHISQKPITGWSIIKRSFVDDVAARAGSEVISTELSRFASGSLTGVDSIDYDEFKDGQGMAAAKFITPRTWKGQSGFYINKGVLRSQAGSDFTVWPRRRVMDVACDVAQKALQPFMNSLVRVLADGTGRIDPRDAEKIEKRVNAALSAALKLPNNAEGTAGHVSAVRYSVDLEHNVLATDKVQGTVAIVPVGYAHEIETDLGFAASVE